MRILVFFSFFVLTQGQVDRDWSFESMCKFYGGKDYKSRTGGFNSHQGDTCDFQISHATDKDDALRFCEENVPYHIIEATPGDITTCRAEATLICKNGWVQMFGRCYKLTRRMMLREDAGKHCEAQKVDIGRDVRIAFLHREALPFRINDYFTKVDQVWMDASEAITRDLIHDKGGSLLLALNGYPFHLPNVALARVYPHVKAMPLCEYTPELTRSESNYLLKRYGEIFYPTVVTNEGAFIRTASSRNRVEDDENADNEYCTKVMKPFIPDTQAQSAIPTEDFIYEVNRVHKGSSVIIRTSAHSENTDKAKRMSSSCVAAKHPIHKMALAGSNKKHTIEKGWRSGQPEEMCDAGSWSAAIVTGRDGTPGLETMSDARYAPIYCQTVLKNVTYGPCQDGFKLFKRENNQHWCHRFFPIRKTQSDAELECQTYRAHLTGYTSRHELEFLRDLMGTHYSWGPTFSNDTWLGATRHPECVKVGAKTSSSYNTDDESDICSRLRIFSWQNDVAPNPPAIIGDWDAFYEPNNYALDEYCLAMLKTKRADGTFRMSLNDYRCSMDYWFICGKEAPIIVSSS